MIHQALSVAAHHKDLSRKTHAAAPEEIAGLAEQQRELASQCKALFPPPPPHPNSSQQPINTLSEAAANLESGDRDAAITSQNQAADALRYFILEYALKYVAVPPPAPPADPSRL